MRWIAYGDGWEHTSEDGPPESVPPFGVLAIAQWSDLYGYDLIRGRTYYCFSYRTREWQCRDILGLYDFLAHDAGVVRFGRSVPDAQWGEMLQRAASDSRLPPRSAERPDTDPEITD